MEETQAVIATAPPFRHPSPDGPLLDELVASYEHITGDPVRRPKKRHFIAACYRVHGEEFLPLVERLFMAKGSITNLLGEIRRLVPTPTRTTELEGSPPPLPSVTHASSEPLPRVIYSDADRVPFDPASTRRYDRRRSNPDAAGFFSDEEMGVPSPTARALSR